LFRKRTHTPTIKLDDTQAAFDAVNHLIQLGHQKIHMITGMYAMRELLLRNRDFSAVFVSSDELALGAIRVLLDEGIHIPEEIS
jgi:LacI family transcriptional regulator